MLLLQSLYLCLIAQFGCGSLLGVVFLQLELGLVGLGDLFLLGLLILLHAGSIVAGVVGQSLIQLDEVRNNLVRVVSLPELQVGATLQQFTHTLGLFDTRHLDHDAAILSLQLLDVGLDDAKLVDTVANYVERVVNG